jgi:magnesium-transporting ATPase (P-type)
LCRWTKRGATRIEIANDEMAQKGMRVLGLALQSAARCADRELENNLILSAWWA